MINPTPTHCFHCGLALPKLGVIRCNIADTPQHFCCNGCAQVCSIIHDNGLDSFYKHAPQDRSWDTPQQAPEDAKVFDRIELQTNFVRQRPDGSMQADLLIEGIHCPACVWLIEHSLRLREGVTYAEVSYTRHRLRLRWLPDKILLSDAILAIGKIGYKATPYEEDLEQKANKKKQQELLFRMAFAGFVFANAMTAAVCLYGGDFFGIEAKWKALFQWYSMVLTFAGITYSGRTFFISAWKAIKTLRLNMDVPISIGIAASFLWSSSITIFPNLTAESHVYFDSITMFVFLILAGRYLESSARETAGSATRHLLALLPRSTRKIEMNGSVSLVPLQTIREGDRILIKPGDRIPVDGDVVAGSSEVDEAIISGESLPLLKQAGSNVIGGTLNLSGQLEVVATHIGHDSVLAQIVEMVDQAQSTKVQIQNLADRIVPWFVSIVILLSLLTFAYWFEHASLAFAMTTAITVLIITCPCALGLATPMAIAIGGGLGGKLGILIRRGNALEEISTISHMVFDKTGTITLGNMHTLHYEACVDHAEVIFSYIRALERVSAHPLAQAIETTLQNHPASSNLSGFANISGFGVQGEFDNQMIHVGSMGWLQQHGVTTTPAIQSAMAQFEADGATIVTAFDDHTLLAWFALGDKLRPEAEHVLKSLQQQGLGLSLVTGDRYAAANGMLKKIKGLSPPMQMIAEVLPHEKAENIQFLQCKGLIVGMVGDGVNDAPALTQANVGIAMGQASDISAHSADIVLLGGLEKLPVALSLSRQTMRTIKQNLVISIGYNILVVPLAIAGMVHPLLAAIAMPASSLLVIGNALLIHRRVKG